MSQTVNLLTRSAPLARVVTPNSTDFPFATVLPAAANPRLDSSALVTQGANGAWLIASGLTCDGLLWLQPFALGPPGQQFSLQVWGYRRLPTDQNESLNVYPPAFLCELACTTANIPGQPGGSLLDTEYLCDTIVLAAGSLGTNGEIGSPATDPTSPRPGLPGFAVVNLRGSELFRVIFQQTDSVAMNALWAPLTP